METAILKHVKTLYRHNQAPVRASIIADMIGKGDRDVRRILARLEERGMVERRGQRGGWSPAKPISPHVLTYAEIGFIFLAGCQRVELVN